MNLPSKNIPLKVNSQLCIFYNKAFPRAEVFLVVFLCSVMCLFTFLCMFSVKNRHTEYTCIGCLLYSCTLLF